MMEAANPARKEADIVAENAPDKILYDLTTVNELSTEHTRRIRDEVLYDYKDMKRR